MANMSFNSRKEANEWYKSHHFSLIDNYIYFYHLTTKDLRGRTTNGRFMVLPSYPDTITDSMSSTFQQTNAIARSAPVFSYSYSGPRTVQVQLTLHRDMMDVVNYDVSDIPVDIKDDYVDTLIKCLQTVTLPAYRASSKSVEPPMIAVRFGNEVFIKGVVVGSVGVTYNKPILDNDKYALVNVSFTVYEVNPYDAETVAKQGSFRGVTSTAPYVIE